MSETARAVSIPFDLTGSLIFAVAALSASRLSRRGLWSFRGNKGCLAGNGRGSRSTAGVERSGPRWAQGCVSATRARPDDEVILVPRKRGRRECRVLGRTRSLACNSKNTRVVTTGQPDNPAFPAQWF